MKQQPKICKRCRRSYIPTGGGQRYCAKCRPINEREKRREQQRKNYAANPQRFCAKAKIWRGAHPKEQAARTCKLCRESYVPLSGNQKNYCVKCTPRCDTPTCPGFDSNLHRSVVAQNGITTFTCKANPGEQHYPPHYAYRGPHGEVAVRIPGTLGRFRYIGRITGTSVETEYDPRNPRRRANVSAAVRASWAHPSTRNRRIIGLTSEGVQARKAATLRATVAKRRATREAEQAELASWRSSRKSTNRPAHRPRVKDPIASAADTLRSQNMSWGTIAKKLDPSGFKSDPKGATDRIRLAVAYRRGESTKP
jgi:hypothetical protein